MKNKLQLRTAVATLMLIASMVAGPAQPIPKSAPAVNPATGLPAPGGAPTIDPTTGLPVTPAAWSEPQWIDPNWPDPDIVLTNVFYDGLPLSEVARQLRESFKDHFDILPMPKTFGKDWGTDTTIQLQLKHVKASDVFNAMNLVFENDRTPLRWELKMNYNRPMAQLRVLPEAAPELTRRIYFVGDLLGDEKTGGMTMEQLVQTVSDVWQTAYGNSGEVIQFYKQAQLIIVTGTAEQTDFVQQTLTALRQKDHLERKSAEAKIKPEEPNPAGPK